MNVEHATELIREYRVTRRDVARQVGFHPSLLTRYLRGEKRPSEATLAKIYTAIHQVKAANVAAAETREAILNGR